MIYIKKDNYNIVEAPYMIEKNNKKIYGYNKQSNEKMLLEDGYLKYSGKYPVSYLDIIDGKIIEKTIENVTNDVSSEVYSKLQIRRAARSIGKEDLLDKILNSSPQLYADWQDANEIDLYDDMITSLSAYTDIDFIDFINEIKDAIK